jgi:hypothetical protein
MFQDTGGTEENHGSPQPSWSVTEIQTGYLSNTNQELYRTPTCSVVCPEDWTIQKPPNHV